MPKSFLSSSSLHDANPLVIRSASCNFVSTWKISICPFLHKSWINFSPSSDFFSINFKHCICICDRLLANAWYSFLTKIDSTLIYGLLGLFLRKPMNNWLTSSQTRNNNPETDKLIVTLLLFPLCQGLHNFRNF